MSETKFKVDEEVLIVVPGTRAFIKEVSFCAGSAMYYLKDKDGNPWSDQPAMDSDLAKIEKKNKEDE